MALVHRDDIAALLPAVAPGEPLADLHNAARKSWPGISPASVLALTSSLIADGLAARVDDPEGYHLYHLTEDPR